MGETGQGLEPARVAEVLVWRPGGRPGRRGSGYRVGETCVLTAAHVVADPVESIRVRFDADLPEEWSADARVVLLSEAADIALLELGYVPAARLGAVSSPRYAAVPDADVVLPFTAVGFPRFKLRQDIPRPPLDDASSVQYRDSCHLSGTVSVLSNRREGTLELAVVAPPADVEPERSPWEGMSGAVVWSEGAVIGVVSAHHRADGLGRLAARRVERWYDTLSPVELDLMARHAGLPPRESLGAPGATHQVTSLAGLPDNLPLRDLMLLVDVLMTLPTLRAPGGMSFVLDSISSVIAANSPRDSRLRFDLIGVVRTCLRYPGTLDQFLEAVRLLEGPSTEVERVNTVTDQLARQHG
ncbi:trypsin-like peptidase domain-containing protein [Streptomyces sp. NPDC002888]|uniref:effector-associated domain 2-containing protein n=1 Tax=Streptomyces sp. NPDC002888 TaxID=3364668 RepID=UPI003677B10D